jgi:hypothetical protein
MVLDDAMDLDALIGLTAGAQGYIGRDTGPMHLAAALDRPVLAVFGGGHWSRFTPVARTAVVLTMDVPCSRCDWQCHFSDSYCVKEIPVAAVTSAMDHLAAGTVEGVQIAELPRDHATVTAMEREANACVRADRITRTVLQAQVSRSLQEKQSLAVVVEQTQAQVELSQAQVEQLQAKLEQLQAHAEQLQAEVSVKHAEVSRGLQEKDSLLRSAEQSQAHIERLQAQVGHAREQVQQLLASRWRKLGRALGVIKLTSVEKISSHGASS